MRAFFRGWRRKVGCVTLAMAVFLCAAWFRSLIVTDIFDKPAFGDHYFLQSGHGVVAFFRELNLAMFVKGWYGHGVVEHSNPEFKYSKWNEPWKLDESWRCCWQNGIGDAAFGCHEQVGGPRLR